MGSRLYAVLFLFYLHVGEEQTLDWLTEDRFLVADAAYPLKKWILKPYPGRKVKQPERTFNKCLSRARQTIERSFGMLVKQWRIIKHGLDCSEAVNHRIIMTCCCLHNLIRKDGVDYSQPIGEEEVAGSPINIREYLYSKLHEDGMLNIIASDDAKAADRAGRYRRNLECEALKMEGVFWD